jgi:hypothetical protein
MTAFDTVRENGYLFRFENTDAWFASDKQPPKDLLQAWDGEEISRDDAEALIDADLVRSRLTYTVDGTKVDVFTVTSEAELARS